MDTPVQTKERILSLIEEHKDKIKALRVRKLGLFGSFVSEGYHAESDVDLLVEFEQGICRSQAKVPTLKQEIQRIIREESRHYL